MIAFNNDFVNKPLQKLFGSDIYFAIKDGFKDNHIEFLSLFAYMLSPKLTTHHNGRVYSIWTFLHQNEPFFNKDSIM